MGTSIRIFSVHPYMNLNGYLNVIIFKFDAKITIFFLILILCDLMMNNEISIHSKQTFTYYYNY